MSDFWCLSSVGGIVLAQRLVSLAAMLAAPLALRSENRDAVGGIVLAQILVLRAAPLDSENRQS